MAMDQSTRDARHPSVTVRPADAALPAVAALLAETVRPADVESTEDAADPRVNVQDPEAALLSAPHSCFRCQLLYWVGALMLLLGVVCVPIALFTRIPTRPALTVTTSPTPGNSEKPSNLTVTPVPRNSCPKATGQVSHVPSLGHPFLPSESIPLP